jgi:hypothetical protein
VTSWQSSGIQQHAQLHMSVGQDILTASMCILLEVTSLIQCRPPLTLRDARLGSRLCSHRETVKLALHPCQQAAAFLACTRPPDFIPFHSPLVTVSTPGPVPNTYSMEQLQVQDYWDRIIGTETTVKSIIRFYIYTPSSNPTMSPRS